MKSLLAFRIYEHIYDVELNTALLAGPLSETSQHDFINSIEPALTPYLQADPYINSVISGDISDHFGALR